MTEELVDIVDDDDNVIATVTRSEMRARRLQHRSVGIAVMSTDGRLLVHRRSLDKDIWPGWWDIAAGGVVAAGETYEAAARRELARSSGYRRRRRVPRTVALRRRRRGRDLSWLPGRARRPVRRSTTARSVEVRWVTFAELDAMRATHQFLPDSIALLLPLLRSLTRFRFRRPGIPLCDEQPCSRRGELK